MNNNRAMFKKRKPQKNAIIFLLVTALALASVGILLAIINRNNQNAPTNAPISSNIDVVSDLPSSEPSSEVVSEAPPQPQTVKILGVGDNLIHSGIYQQANRRSTTGGYDFAFAYEQIADIIAGADIASLNQETVLSSEHKPATYPMFNSPQELGDEMLKIGFDVFNQATNHSIDKGESGLLSTLAYWKSKPNATVVGAYENKTDYENIRTIKKGDITFSFLGMTELTNGLNLPENGEAVLMRTQDRDEIKRKLEAAKAISDVVVVNVHWGVEYTHTPNSNQTDLAKFMVENGADIIFGHHPHVIQPVEYITRADGTRGIVCYSLGNFISAQNKAPRMLGGMLDVAVTKDMETGITTITDATFLPVVTQYERNFSNIRTYPFSKYTKELADAHGVKENSPEFSYDYLTQTIESVIDPQFLK